MEFRSREFKPSAHPLALEGEARVLGALKGSTCLLLVRGGGAETGTWPHGDDEAAVMSFHLNKRVIRVIAAS